MTESNAYSYRQTLRIKDHALRRNSGPVYVACVYRITILCVSSTVLPYYKIIFTIESKSRRFLIIYRLTYRYSLGIKKNSLFAYSGTVYIMISFVIRKVTAVHPSNKILRVTIYYRRRASPLLSNAYFNFYLIKEHAVYANPCSIYSTGATPIIIPYYQVISSVKSDNGAMLSLYCGINFQSRSIEY